MSLFKNQDLDASPEAYLNDQGIKFKTTGAHEARFPCPVCNEKEGFNMNLKTGLWKCLRASCDESGNLYRLKVLHGNAYEVRAPVNTIDDERNAELARQMQTRMKDSDKWIKSLRTSERAQHARNYLDQRGIGPTTRRVADLGWVAQHPGGSRTPQNGRNGVRRKVRRSTGTKPVETKPDASKDVPGLITIPYKRQDRSTAMLKMRHVPPEPRRDGKIMRYARLKGGESILYAPGKLEGTVLIVGGELDALSIVQVLVDEELWGKSPGFSVVSVPDGEGSWKTQFTDELAHIEDIVVAFDNDAAGRKASEKVSEALGRHRCRIGRWPDDANDPNELLMQGKLTIDLIRTVLEGASAPAGSSLVSSQQLEDEVVSHLFGGREVTGYPTGIKGLDALIGGFRDREVTIVTGHTGSGKTTFVSQLAAFQAFDPEGPQRRVLFMPFEMGARAQLVKLIRQHLNKDPVDLSEDEVRGVIREFGSKMLFLDHYGAIERDAFKETLLYAVNRLGVEFVVVDHLHYMVPRWVSDRWERIDALVETLQKIVISHDVHCLLVAHPAKIGEGKNRDDAIVQLGDIKGHSDIIQDCANAMTVYRPRSADRSDNDGGEDRYAEAGLVVLKQRDSHGAEGNIELRFDRSTNLFGDPALSFTPRTKRRNTHTGGHEGWKPYAD